MIINVIHNKARADRYELMMKEFNEHKLSLHIHDAVTDIAPKIGIALAHQHIVRAAKSMELSEVVIAEDDFHVLGKGAMELFELNKPEDYDLYLASIYWGRIDGDNIVKDFAGLTLYCCHSRFYDKFLSIEPKKNRSIDRAMAQLGGKYVVCNPFTVIQHETPSDNHHDRHGNRLTVSNEKWLKGRRLYAVDTVL